MKKTLAGAVVAVGAAVVIFFVATRAKQENSDTPGQTADNPEAAALSLPQSSQAEALDAGDLERLREALPDSSGTEVSAESSLTMSAYADAADLEDTRPSSKATARIRASRGAALPRSKAAPGETPRAAASASPLARAAALIRQGKKYEARGLLTPVLLNCKKPPFRLKIKQVLDELNKELFFSPMPTPDSEFYMVRENDSYWNIAKATRNGIDLIKMVNQKSSDVLRPGQRLKIMKGAFSVLVEKSKFRLTVLLDGHYIKEYAVGVGRDNKTPNGIFEIASQKMVKNPAWTAPDGRVYPFGHPKNILGTRWIKFKETTAYNGYGIHGTTEPESIGKPSSNGCIRMHNRDVEELFAMLNPGDKVTIIK